MDEKPLLRKQIFYRRKQELLEQYEDIFYKYLTSKIKLEEFDKDKHRIQISMLDHSIPFDSKQAARRAGVNKANNENDENRQYT